jgi:hypothetical protein
VTIDLRGIGHRLQAQAASRGATLAAVVRAAIAALLDAAGDAVQVQRTPMSADAPVAKVTLRVSTSYAARLADRACAAGVSQGAYLQPAVASVAMSVVTGRVANRCR